MQTDSNSSPRFTLCDVPKALWFFLGEDRAGYCKYFATFLIAQSWELGPPALIALMVDFLLAYRPGDNLDKLYWLIGGVVVGGIVATLVRVGSRRKLAQYAINSRYRAKVWGFERLLNFSLTWHQAEGTGNKAQRIMTGSDSLREWFGFLYSDLASTLIFLIGAITACLLLSPWFILFFVYFVGGLLAVEIHYDRKIAELSAHINQSQENASGAFVESAANILAVKAMGAGDGVTRKVVNREEKARILGHERVRLSTAKLTGYQIHNSIAWGIFLAAVAWAVLDHRLSAGLVLLYTSYFNSVRQSTMTFVDRFQVMVERHADLARMMPFFWNESTAKCGNEKFPQHWQAIEFSDAHFRYRENAALDGIDLRVRRGEKLGVAGHSGSGKSTLVKLLLGLYHLDTGELKIGHTPLAAIRHDELTRNIAVVLQETDLFNLSLKENITMMRDADPEQLARACRIACLDELITRLPDGENTLVGERGYALSGGERQRVGIARAIYKNVPVLLLDEATSALDSATEAQVMARLLGECPPEQTLIVIAHRISTLRQTDRIVVLEGGRIVEKGTFAELTAQPDTHLGGMFALQTG